jgi:membrane protein DedA with SNARE-associated domain
VPRNKALLLVAIVTLVVGGLQAANVVQFPFGVWFSKLVGSMFTSTTLNNFMTSSGYLSLFILMVLESTSLPVPSEVVLPFAGYMVYVGTLSFWPVVIVSTVASLTGALVDYYLAKWLGRPFVIGLLKLFKLHEGALDRAEAWFEKSGQWTVFAARFVPALRTLISLPAGLFEMEIPTFVVMTVAGCFAWSVVLVYAGLLAGSASSSAFASSPTVVEGLSAVFAIVSGAYVVYYLLSAWASPEPPASPPSSGA